MHTGFHYHDEMMSINEIDGQIQQTETGGD